MDYNGNVAPLDLLGTWRKYKGKRRTGAGKLPPGSGLLRAEGVELALGSLKKAEDGEALILGPYEPHGARGESILHLDREVKRAERTNLLEEVESSGPPLAVEGDALRVEVRPFEVLTLRLEL